MIEVKDYRAVLDLSAGCRLFLITVLECSGQGFAFPLNVKTKGDNGSFHLDAGVPASRRRLRSREHCTRDDKCNQDTRPSSGIPLHDAHPFFGYVRNQVFGTPFS